MGDNSESEPAVQPESQIYSCFNFRLRSEVPLPELPLATCRDAGPIVDVVRARLPGSSKHASDAPWRLSVTNGEALLQVPDIAHFLISHGERIVVDPLPETTDRELRLFLLGSALGVLAHQRGLLLLHANAVQVRDGAAAFGGPSGSGKSTLAAHFKRAGHVLLTDDVCAIEFDAEDRALVWPGIPRLKLWADAARALGHDPNKMERVTEKIDKYQLKDTHPANAEPLPLRRFYVLSRAEDGCQGAIARVNGREAMAALLANTYRGVYLAPLGLAERHFSQCLRLLQTVSIYSASRVWGFDAFDREAESLEQHMLCEGADECR